MNATTKPLDITDKWDELVKIDRNELDEELIRQPGIYLAICEEFSDAISQRDFAEAELNKKCSAVSLQIRQNPASFPFKLTEDSIAAAILTNPEVVQLREAYLTHKAIATRLGNLKDVFEQRANMLDKLVRLFIAGYFMDTGPAQPGAAGDMDPRTAFYRRLRQEYRETTTS